MFILVSFMVGTIFIAVGISVLKLDKISFIRFACGVFATSLGLAMTEDGWNMFVELLKSII